MWRLSRSPKNLARVACELSVPRVAQAHAPTMTVSWTSSESTMLSSSAKKAFRYPRVWGAGIPSLSGCSETPRSPRVHRGGW